MSRKNTLKDNRAIRNRDLVINDIHRLLLYGKKDSSLFMKVCKKIQDLGGYSLVWIGLSGTKKNSNAVMEPVAFYSPGNGGGSSAKEIIRMSLETWDLSSGLPVGKKPRTFGTDYIRRNFPSPFTELLETKGIGSLAVIPLRYDRSIVGFLNIYSRNKDINTDELDVLDEVAKNIANDTRGLKLELELKSTSKQLRKALYETIDAITLMSEIKDPYTSGHQKKVALLASAISEEMGLPKDIIDGIYVSGLLHDVGKISVPNDILAKPGQLNEGEFIIVKNHPLVSYDILKNIEFPWPIADIVSQHHEKIDGSGYPGGMKKADIMLESRILAVADVVEAMTAHRPYRPALGIKKAMGEIKDNKNRLYDKNIVEACITVLENNKIKL